MLKTRYWDESDDLYIYLRDAIADGEAAWQVPFDYEHPELGGIVADLSESGGLLGLEILDVKHRIVWRPIGSAIGPAFGESYDPAADVFRVSFGGHSARTIVITDQMFDNFVVHVGLDRTGRVTEISIPRASRQIGAEWLGG